MEVKFLWGLIFPDSKKFQYYSSMAPIYQNNCITVLNFVMVWMSSYIWTLGSSWWCCLRKSRRLSFVGENAALEADWGSRATAILSALSLLWLKKPATCCHDALPPPHLWSREPKSFTSYLTMVVYHIKKNRLWTSYCAHLFCSSGSGGNEDYS